MNPHSLQSYQYHLPEELIAQLPVSPAESARLLVLNGEEFLDKHFYDLPTLLPEESLVFINDTRVLKARIRTQARIIRPSGTVQNRMIELLYLESSFSETEKHLLFEAMVFPGDAFPLNAKCEIGGKILTVQSISYRGRVFSTEQILSQEALYEFLEINGEFPIPPYIESTSDAQEGYQTVFAENPGSLAAPTASLHFSKNLLGKLEESSIRIIPATLHVGIGTFKTVNEPDIRNHRIHPEIGTLPLEIFRTIARSRVGGKSLIGVGTTMIRLLESLPFVWNLLKQKNLFEPDVQDWWDARYKFAKNYEAERVEYLILQDSLHSNDFPNIQSSSSTQDSSKEYQKEAANHMRYEFVRIREETNISVIFDSSLFIYTGFKPSIATGMITNFHLPESTLLMMIGALCQKNRIDLMYQYAIREKYRFYSFGDGCYLPFSTEPME